ncbi:MAG: hypothetical protein AAB362_01820 [Patescibacteria group bacterium]|mgnify:CR=1 FL=1
MEESLLKEIRELRQKVDEIGASVEATKKYLLWTFIGSVLVFVLPLIGLMVVVPQFLSSYGDVIQ